MPRNIEIKARLAGSPGASGLADLLPRAQALADAPAELIEQDDSFFELPSGRGRLKLRQFGDGSAELIHYQRADETGARASDYVRSPIPDAETMREALSRALGLSGRVRKRRWLLLRGATRIHLDAVEGLGEFVELEVVLQPGQSDADGAATAEGLMLALGLADAPRLAGAYLDLLPSGSGR